MAAERSQTRTRCKGGDRLFHDEPPVLSGQISEQNGSSFSFSQVPARSSIVPPIGAKMRCKEKQQQGAHLRPLFIAHNPSFVREARRPSFLKAVTSSTGGQWWLSGKADTLSQRIGRFGRHPSTTAWTETVS